MFTILCVFTMIGYFTVGVALWICVLDNYILEYPRYDSVFSSLFFDIIHHDLFNWLFVVGWPIVLPLILVGYFILSVIEVIANKKRSRLINKNIKERLESYGVPNGNPTEKEDEQC